MGAMLNKPVMSIVMERKTRVECGFRVGVAEMNGWRNKMEDAHVIHLKEDWAFLGVFDGHGGDQCSAFVAKEFYKRLAENGCPKDDAAIKEMVLDIDQKYLDTETPSGTTGAMCIVHRTGPGGKLRLRVINAGDSRVFLGRRDGTIVDGALSKPGYECTEQGLSRDHKPNDPLEKERIYRCGGTVEEPQAGVARVNGDLAVSRGFGDAEYKKTGGPGQEDRPVTCDPELGEFECDESDFLVIACDGVSEGDFPNPEVVKFIAERLKESSFAGKPGDPAIAAREVCFKAEKMNSKDNITCMIVLFDGADEAVDESIEFEPGHFLDANPKFLDAHEVMARRGRLEGTREEVLAEAVKRRYAYVTKELAGCDPADDAKAQTLREEKEKMEDGMEDGTFDAKKWLESQRGDESGGGGGMGGMSQNDVLQMLMRQAGGPAMINQLVQGKKEQKEDGRKVKMPTLEVLKASVEAHPALAWDDKMTELAETEGVVAQEDKDDATMKVKFQQHSIEAWVPTECVTILDGGDAADADGGSGGYAGESPATAAAE